ncbi:tetratricopeptide repeat protein [Aquimarina sp. MMG016]|uniref:tetratricopeptide repeat protein n=1 Tax=Aquimarina sp. MMG016 TaxID=2822690 RepID=UPI001B3A4E6F|nr:tetratricopeptide repeat protein [Aquimarina sp. MMG016]MBQ4821218.1 tetratricopeptide repeat protein [Aquimarina sp. MMG016]
MGVQRIVYFVFIISSIFNIHAQNQSPEELCDELSKQLDTIHNLDVRLRLCKQMDHKVDVVCRVNLYIEQGNIYRAKQQVDSSKYYTEKAIKLGESSEKAEEILTWAYAKKAEVLFSNGEEDKAIILLKKVRNLLTKYPNSEHWVSYYRSFQEFSAKKINYKKAIQYADSIIIAAKRSNDSIEIPNAYHNKGFYFVKLGEYEKAAENLIKATELKERMKDLSDIAATYYVLGASYVRWEKYEVANKYFKKSIAISKEFNDDYILMISYLRLAKSKRKLKDFEESLKIIDSALSIAKNLNSQSQLAEGYMEQGFIYFENFKDYDKAESFFIKAFEKAKQSNNDLIIYSTIESLVKIHLHNKDYNEVKVLLETLKEVTQKINTKDHTLRLHKRYSDYYEQIGRSNLALLHLKKYYLIKDSIANTEIKTKVADLEKKYDTKKKELEIVNLNQEKKAQEQVVQLATSKQQLYLLTSLFLLFLLVVGTWTFIKLRKQKNELTATNQVKNRLFSIIAHDLRGMIIPFQRSGKILKHHIDKGNHERTIELSNEIEKNSESLSNMLDNLLNWSLEQMNGYKMNPEQISIKAELKEIIEGYEQEAAFKNSKISLKYEEDIAAMFDKGAFHVIFRNLIGNALKYTEDGNIRVEFTKDFNTLLCSVIDTGVGMSEKQLQDIFTLGEEKITIGTQGEKGTGLGLNLVNRFVKMHNGSIKVSSEKRIGTRFDLTFPKLEPLTTDQSDNLESMSA